MNVRYDSKSTPRGLLPGRPPLHPRSHSSKKINEDPKSLTPTTTTTDSKSSGKDGGNMTNRKLFYGSETDVATSSSSKFDKKKVSASTGTNASSSLTAETSHASNSVANKECKVLGASLTNPNTTQLEPSSPAVAAVYPIPFFLEDDDDKDGPPRDANGQLDIDAFIYRHFHPLPRHEDFSSIFYQLPQEQWEQHPHRQKPNPPPVPVLDTSPRSCSTPRHRSKNIRVIVSHFFRDLVDRGRPPCIPLVEAVVGQGLADRMHFAVAYFLELLAHPSQYLMKTFKQNLRSTYFGTLNLMERQLQEAVSCDENDDGNGNLPNSDRALGEWLAAAYTGAALRIETLIGVMQVFKQTKEKISFHPNVGILWCYNKHTEEQNLRLNKILIGWMYQHWDNPKSCTEAEIVTMAVDHEISPVAIDEWIERALDLVWEPTNGKNLVPAECMYRATLELKEG